MQFNGLKLSGALEEFSITFNFFGFENAKKNMKNKGFECSFLQIEVQVILSPSSRLEKYQTSKFLLINNFL